LYCHGALCHQREPQSHAALRGRKPACIQPPVFIGLREICSDRVGGGGIQWWLGEGFEDRDRQRERERERETTGTHDEKRSLTVGRHGGGHADGVDRGDYTAEHVLGARDVRMVH
jgi:hypothetical protein